MDNDANIIFTREWATVLLENRQLIERWKSLPKPKNDIEKDLQKRMTAVLGRIHQIAIGRQAKNGAVRQEASVLGKVRYALRVLDDVEDEYRHRGQVGSGTLHRLALAETFDEVHTMSRIKEFLSEDKEPEPTGTLLVQGVDINSATAKEIEAIQLVGPWKAKAIVQYRAANGPFSTLSDLRVIPGVGVLLAGDPPSPISDVLQWKALVVKMAWVAANKEFLGHASSVKDVDAAFSRFWNRATVRQGASWTDKTKDNPAGEGVEDELFTNWIPHFSQAGVEYEKD